MKVKATRQRAEGPRKSETGHEVWIYLIECFLCVIRTYYLVGSFCKIFPFSSIFLCFPYVFWSFLCLRIIDGNLIISKTSFFY